MKAMQARNHNFASSSFCIVNTGCWFGLLLQVEGNYGDYSISEKTTAFQKLRKGYSFKPLSHCPKIDTRWTHDKGNVQIWL